MGIPSVLSSLAILKVNFDQQGYDFIDNFVPFVVEVLRVAGRPGLSTSSTADGLHSTFGIAIPEGAVTSILRRAVRRRLAEARGFGVYALSDLGEQSPEIAGARHSAEVGQQLLVDRLVQFSGSHLPAPWSAEQAEGALIRFASSRGAEVLASMGSLFDSAPASQAPDEEHLLGEFVVDLRASDAVGFGQLETLVKGALLASAMYYPDLGRLPSRFERLEVLLDTRIVLRALGTAGPQQESAAREHLELLYELGASLAVFDITLGEVRKVLSAASYALRQSSRLREHSGETLEYLASKGYRSSDIELIIAQLERRLGALRISIRARPAHTERLTIDEASLEQQLKDANVGRPYAEEALRHDVAAVTAVYRMRGGQTQPVLEAARAVFLTTNALLMRVSGSFFRRDDGAESVPLCYLDYQFATLAWLKKPTAAPALPMRQVIADSYAALNPPDGLWRAYLAEIARLEARGDISADDYYALRFTMTAKSALVDAAKAGERVNDSVPEILAKVKAVIRAEVAEEIAGMGSSRSVGGQVAELASAREQLAADRARREAAFQGYATSMGEFVSRLALVPASLAVALVVYLLASPLLPALPGPALEQLRPLLYVLAFFVALLTILNLTLGTSLKSVSRWIEIRVSRRTEEFLRRRFL